MGIYLYAVMSGEHRLDLGEIGLPDGWTRVVTMCGSDLTAVVSEYEGPAFSELPNLDVMRRLAVHQRVVERAMADHPVLPVKFGTVLGSDVEVTGVLDCWHSEISATIQHLGDAVEIELAATWDLRQTFAKIACEPQITSLTATVAGRPAGETGETRIQIGKLVKEALDRRREEYRQEVVRHLFAVVRDAQSNVLPSDELVFNVALLVERAKIDEFYARIHRLDGVFENQLTFRCIGPLPPYSFATVEISQIRADEIDTARGLLGLGGGHIAEKELNNNYRRLAFHCHPDRNPDDPTASMRFAALTAAYDLLLAYAHGQSTAAGKMASKVRRDRPSAMGKNAILLRIKRSEPLPIADAEVSRDPDHAAV